MVFEWFAELLMNTTKETVEPAMHAAAEDICGDYPDIVPNDTRNLMGFFMMLRKLLAEVREGAPKLRNSMRLTEWAPISVVLTTLPLPISPNRRTSDLLRYFPI